MHITGRTREKYGDLLEAGAVWHTPAGTVWIPALQVSQLRDQSLQRDDAHEWPQQPGHWRERHIPTAGGNFHYGSATS